MHENKDLAALRELADLDARKRELNARVEAITVARAAREEELLGLREELAKAESDFDGLQRERRSLEALVEDKTNLLAKYRAQLDVVKTNKEYQSLQHEIEMTRREISAAEDRLLDALERTEAALAAGERRRGAVAASESGAALENEHAAAELKDIDIQLIEVEEKRRRLLPSLSPAIKHEYERVFEHYRGDAFARALGGVCQGCFVNIPAQVLSEVQAGSRIYRCESCGRFVIIVEEEY